MRALETRSAPAEAPASSAASPAEEALPEGEEQTPPGTRTMAIVRWTIVVLVALAAVGTWVHYAVSSGAYVERALYHCPMHPNVVASGPGECPICGMDLVPVSAGQGSAASPGVAGHEATHADAGPLYVCPMHPEFVTSDAKARCPECGMKLSPKEPEAAAPSAVGVAGLAAVDLTAERIQLLGLRTGLATRERLPSTLRTVGFVTASERGLVSITTRFTGWLESLAAAETGQPVQKGQILATLYSPELRTAQEVFLNAIRWSGKRDAPPPPSMAPIHQVANDLERDARQRLLLLGIASEDIDALARTGTATDTMNVRSPVRGYVARKGALPGIYVQPGTELFQIADLSTIWVLADVYESDIGRVKVGQRAALELDAWPGETFAGRVTFLYPALDTGSRTLQARLEIKNPGLRLRPGMYGDVTVEVGSVEAVVVPREAIVDTGELQYVFVSRGGGRFEPRRVRVGAAGGGKVAIVEGLAEGERVVTTSNFLLDSESRLRAALVGGAGR